MAKITVYDAAPHSLRLKDIFDPKGKWGAMSISKQADSIAVKNSDGTKTVIKGTGFGDPTSQDLDDYLLNANSSITTIEYRSKEGDLLLKVTGIVGLTVLYFKGLIDDNPAWSPANIANWITQYADTFIGSKRDDWFDGYGGDDRFFGGRGADLFDGRDPGTDTVFYSTQVTLDMLDRTKGTGEAKGDKLLDIEVVEGSEYGDTLKGSLEVETIRGMGGNDTIVGRGGPGGWTSELLEGGSGNDTIRTGAGVTDVVGGRGADKMYGHATGSDRFIYKSLAELGKTPETADTIYGFGAGDQLNLSLLDADAITPGDQGFQAAPEGFTAAGQYRVVDIGTDSVLQLNYDDDLQADAFIRLANWSLSDYQSGQFGYF